MTYFTILFLFLIPPLLALVIFVPRDLWGWIFFRRKKPDLRPYWIILAHIMIALIYTTPWDNYLVATSVWWYDPDLVAGLRLGWVPIEEYLFFILQTLLTGLITIELGRRLGVDPRKTIDRPALRNLSGILVGLIWAISTWFLFFGDSSLKYLTLILSWALIPVLIQVIFGMDILAANWRVLLLGIVPTTIYLWILDITALTAGTWTIDPQQTTGIKFGVVPIEEMVFFLMTNLIIVFGITLMNSESSHKRAAFWLSKFSWKPVFLIALGLWIAVLIATPVGIWTVGDAILPLLATLGVFAQFSASMIALLMNWSIRRVILSLCLVAFITIVVEIMGVKTGIPFGRYHYTPLLQPQVMGVPLLIPFAWVMMLVPSWALSEILLNSPLKKTANPKNGRYRLIFAVLSGLIFTAWDLYLDPQMVGKGLWVWETPGLYFGIPLTNYLGWFVTSALITWIIQPTEIHSGRLILIYVLTWLFQAVGLGIFWNQPGPALTGFLGMGIFVGWAIRKEGLSWRLFSGDLWGSSVGQSRSR